MSRRTWIILSLVVDAVVLNGAIVLAFLIRFGWPIPAFNFSAYEYVVIPLTLGQLAILFLVDLYDAGSRRTGAQLFWIVFKGVLLGGLILVVLTFFMRAFSFPRVVIFIALALQVAFLWGWRRLAAGLFHVQWPSRNILLIGSLEQAGGVADRLGRLESQGYRVTGVADEGLGGLAEEGIWTRLLEALAGPVGSAAQDVAPHYVIFTTPSRHRAALEEIALCPAFTGEIFVVPELYEMHLGEVNLILLGDVPLLRVTRPKRPAWQAGTRRVAEAGFAGLLLLVASPLMILVGLTVLLFSGVPILYRQTRVGRNFAPFALYKFRTMRRDAEAGGPVFASENDRRVTGVGRVLRRSRLDELPQFWNVLRGDMSFVGPRPERPEFVEDFMREDHLYRERFRVRPGITGLAQVSAPYSASAATKLRFDLVYIHHESLLLDLGVVFRTLRVILTGRGAV